MSCVRCSFLLPCVRAFTAQNRIDVESLQSIHGHVSGCELVLASGETVHLDVFMEHGTSTRSMLLGSTMAM